MWRKVQQFLASFVPSLLLLAYLAVIICMLNRWDALVMITLIPIWAWAAIGMMAAILSWILFRGIPSLVVFCLCLVTGIVCSEETHSLLREITHSEEEAVPDNEFVVININCGGVENPITMIAEENPDIITIQDAPSNESLIKLKNEIFGEEYVVLVHRSNAILAKGKILDEIREPESSTLHLRVLHPSKTVLDITSLDLNYCIPRPDMWRPRVWKQLKEARMTNRRLTRSFLGENEIRKSNVIRIVAGAFNTPPGDDVFRPLMTNSLKDVFAESGLSWGNTYPSDYPTLRLDQIWVSETVETVSARTKLNPDSFHRTVVAKMLLPTGNGDL